MILKLYKKINLYDPVRIVFFSTGKSGGLIHFQSVERWQRHDKHCHHKSLTITSILCQAVSSKQLSIAQATASTEETVSVMLVSFPYIAMGPPIALSQRKAPLPALTALNTRPLWATLCRTWHRHQTPLPRGVFFCAFFGRLGYDPLVIDWYNKGYPR